MTKRVLFLVLGLLAVVFSSITILWILYNLVSGDMHPIVKEKLTGNLFFACVYVVGIFSLNLVIFSTGKNWILKSGIINKKKKQNDNIS